MNNCECNATRLDNVDVLYKEVVDVEYIASVKSWEDLLITCKNQKNIQFSDLGFTSQDFQKKINSLSFKYCALGEKTSLKEFVSKLGIKESKAFKFQSFGKSNTSLTREHLQGISNVRELILSHNNLTNISSDFFRDFADLEKLDISNNNLILPDDIFDATPKLTHLFLNKNNITKIEPRLFHELKNLEFLNLGQNHLAVLKDDVFNELSSLNKLNLAGNNFMQISPYIFLKLGKLEKLDISSNSLYLILSNMFKQNKALRYLYFHNNQVNITRLPDHLLSNFIALEYVYLCNNGISKLPVTIFRFSRALRYIDLNQNFLKTLPQHIFRGLRNLRYLGLRKNLIETLPDFIFKDLNNLRKLDLSENIMNFIPKGLFEGLQSLVILDMENNQLKYIEHTALFSLKKLKIAKFSNNQLKFCQISKEFSPFYTNTLLQQLHLSNNSIEYFYEDWTNYRADFKILNLIDLSYNNISKIVLFGIEEASVRETKKRNVILIVNNNPILCDCNLYDFMRYYNKEMPSSVYNYIEIKAGNLSCVHNNGTKGPKIQELDSKTYICQEDEYLSMKDYCQIGCRCYFRPRDQTRILDCSHQNMSQFVFDQNRTNFLINYPLILNFTGNALTRIPLIKPLNLFKIKGLLLSDNNITEITIDKLPESLTILELHNNRISRIDYVVAKYLISSPLKEFTLSGNPIMCDCNSEDLLYFIHMRRYSFKDLENLKCYNIDIYMYRLSIEQLCARKSQPSRDY
ncbi:hypothetical protein M0802_016248 [Mischocyttarus mexicanus]|nr:hypothetical protein M0802_016248 [Mischocyttarus mexicanus]